MGMRVADVERAVPTLEVVAVRVRQEQRQRETLVAQVAMELHGLTA